MKDKILLLRNQGKSYREIEKELKCSKSLISYYVNPNGKLKKLNCQNKNRFRIRKEYKDKLGGKCNTCGYNKCYDALHFHHKDPSQKKFIISQALFQKGAKYSQDEIIAEVKKCILLCANCHAETHSINNYK